MQQNELYYYSIDKTATAEYKDRGSKFIAFAFPIKKVEDVKPLLQQLKKEHTKAVHFCFAYRLGIDGNTFRVSDDGEPSGTAGRPILHAIDSKNITNVLVVVVRYFGGTLLGVPGLINAYKTATALCLQMVPTIQYPIEIMYELQFDYTVANDVMTIIKQFNCTIINQQMQLFTLLTVGVAKSKLQDVLDKLRHLHTVDVKRVG
jgi:uncharacterized YigZ family protein